MVVVQATFFLSSSSFFIKNLLISGVNFQALRPQRWYLKRRRPTQRQEKALTVFATVRGVGSSPFKFSSCSAIFGKLCPLSRKMTALCWLAKLRLRG